MTDNRQTNLIYTSLPDTTSLWPGCSDDVYKLFKVRTCAFDVESILWPANVNGLNLGNWFEPKEDNGMLFGPHKPYYDAWFEHFDKVLKKLDVDDIAWYANEKEELLDDLEKVIALILKAINDFEENSRTRTTYMDRRLQRDIHRMNGRIKDWLSHLRELLEEHLSVSDICEASFEELFRMFLQITGFICRRGDYCAKLQFQYEDKDGALVKRVSSQPDLIVGLTKENLRLFTIAIVEVKRPSTGSQNGSNGEPALGSEDEGPSVHGSAASNNEDDHPCLLLESDYPNGNLRLQTEEEQKECSVFLLQLFGDVLAALNSQKIKLNSLPLGDIHARHLATKSVIGFGVVGFKVYVVNFLSVRRGPLIGIPQFHEIPLTKGMGTDILISEPLHLLKRQDRNTFFRLLCAMKCVDYQN